MSRTITAILDTFVDGVKEILGNHLEKIVLYGSYARGDYNDSSDIDIMILTDLNDEEIEIYKERIYDFAYDIELENDVIISPLVKNIDNFNYWLDALPFYMNVQKEGVVLHG